MNIKILNDILGVEPDQCGDEHNVIFVNTKRKLHFQVGDELEWSKNKNKILRMKGKEYRGMKKNEGGKFVLSEIKSARKIGPRCASSFCKKNVVKRKCFSIKDEDREQLFKTFWNDMTWVERKTYIAALCEINSTKVKTGSIVSRRADTITYFLKINNEKLQVCKKMFLQTLCLNEWSVRNWVSKSSSGTGIHKSPDLVKNKKRVGRFCGGIKEMMAFFNKLPTLPSHYCRSSSNKKYLESFFESKSALYKVYESELAGTNKKVICKTDFFQEFQKRNLALYSPKKDCCDLCEGFKYGHISQNDYDIHQKRKFDARDAKNLSKEHAINNPDKYASLTMDVQAVKLAPFIRASSMYYKTKLCVHNFTIFNQATADVCCYLWDESNGGLESSVFATMTIDYLHNLIENTPTLCNISLFSDGCGYQNRNAVLSNALLKFAMDQKIIITQNFLEKGHTQMEVDSVHHTIEIKLKKREIHLPTDYINVCKDARTKNPYRVKYFDFSCFDDYSSLKYYTSIRPGTSKGDPSVTDIRCLKYKPDSFIQYKLNYDDEWKNLPLRNSKIGVYQVNKLYKEPIKIKNEKFNHLQQLKSVLPKHTWQYYDNLPHISHKTKKKGSQHNSTLVKEVFLN